MIFNFHNPPYNSGLDTAAELDEDLRPVIRGGRPSFVRWVDRRAEAIARCQSTVGLTARSTVARRREDRPDAVPEPRQRHSASLLRGVVVRQAGDGVRRLSVHGG